MSTASLNKPKRGCKVMRSKPLSKAPTMAPRELKPCTLKTYTGKLARRLRQLRLDKGLSVTRIADAIGVEKITVYKWESGENQIDPDKFPALAKVLGVSAAEFFPEFR